MTDEPTLVIDADAGLLGIGRIGQRPEVHRALVDSLTVGVPELRVDATSLAELVAAICGAQSRLCDDLLLHAAAVVEPDGGSGVLLSGPSMAGKSTLAAWLVQHGWGYLSDELVRVLPDGRISAWRKPVSLRETSKELLGVEVPTLTAASAIGAVAEGAFPIGGVVLLESLPTGVTPLSQGHTIARLMQEATRFDGGEHLGSLAAAVGGANSIRLGRAPLESQQMAVTGLVSGELEVPTGPVHRPATDVLAIEGADLEDGLIAVLIADEMVTYDERNRRVAVVDLRALPAEADEDRQIERFESVDVSSTR